MAATAGVASVLGRRRADSGLARRLLGRRCFGGLDLASRLDTAAFALCFPPVGDGSEEKQGKYALLCWHWMPEATAEERKDKVPYFVWRDAGWLVLTEGNVCDYSTIEADVLKLKQLYKIVEVGFDPWNAEGPTQSLERNGIKRHEIPQTVAKLNYASQEFEKLIVSGKIEHDGNPVLDWQIGNVDVYTDTSGNIKPKRPEHGDFRTIDGVAAAIMALDRCLRAPKPVKGSLVIC
jgi:phage terminase large subunit-like protein